MTTMAAAVYDDLATAQVESFFNTGQSGVFEALYQQVNRQALAPFFRTFLNSGGAVLDAGCGSGDLAMHLELTAPCGIDVAFKQLQHGRRQGALGPCAQSDLACLPFQTGTFDAVVCANVLHYTGLPGLRELLRVTRPDGRLLLAFLEESAYTRWAIDLWIAWGLFPAFMRDAPLIDIDELARLNVTIEDSRTVVFLPPTFFVSRTAARKGLVLYVLKKGHTD